MSNSIPKFTQHKNGKQKLSVNTIANTQPFLANDTLLQTSALQGGFQYLYKVIENHEGEDDRENERRSHVDNQDGADHVQEAHEEHVNVLRHGHVDGVHVLAETIDDAPQGGHVKEVHGAMQDVGQKG